MARPPKVGTLELCDFLAPGSSKRCFTLATLMMEGIAKNVTINDVRKDRSIIIIEFSEMYYILSKQK